jgi:hypothetical protein
MLELFSRKPDMLDSSPTNIALTPIPTGEETSSLSAILLEDVYYDFIHTHRKIVSGLPVTGPEALVPLKARAWLDLTARKTRGARIDTKTIRKHKTDIFRLIILFPAYTTLRCPKEIKNDIDRFCHLMTDESGSDVHKSGIVGISKKELLSHLRNLYHT